MSLKTARLGYLWSDDHQYFIGIHAGKPPFTVNLTPAHNVPSHKPKTYLAWHENPNMLRHFEKSLKNYYRRKNRKLSLNSFYH